MKDHRNRSAGTTGRLEPAFKAAFGTGENNGWHVWHLFRLEAPAAASDEIGVPDRMGL